MVRMKLCNQDISKTIIARSFKLGQLIEDNVKMHCCNFKKQCYYIYNKSSSKIISASSFKFGQLIDYLVKLLLIIVIVVWLFLTMPWVCLQFVIVVFPDHTYVLF